jgi:CheY-like chemotaxis protein
MAKCVVLVVEDEPLIRIDLADRLARRGCASLEAGSAAEAIAILEQHPEITVVFTDVQMPGTMDGVQLANYVRKRWPPTIIVVSSGKVRPAPGLLANDMAFMAKPYDEINFDRVLTDVHARLAAT